MWCRAIILQFVVAAADPNYLTDAQNCSQQVCLQGTFLAKLEAHSNVQCMEVCGSAHHGFKSVGMAKCTHFTFSPGGECLIYSSCETLGAGDITFGSGSSQYTLTDTSSFTTCFSPFREKVVADWNLIAAQNIQDGTFPGSVKNTYKYNENDPTKSNYMAIGDLDSEAWKGEDGKYHFKLYFFDEDMNEAAAQVLEFKQASWITEEYPQGVEAISPDDLLTKVNNCAKFQGVGKSGDGCAVIDGNGRHGCWFHAIGSVCRWGKGFPGWNMVSLYQMKLFIWGNPENMATTAW